MAENAFMAICIAFGSVLLLEGFGVNTDWQIGAGIGLISAPLGIVFAAIATGGWR